MGSNTGTVDSKPDKNSGPAKPAAGPQAPLTLPSASVSLKILHRRCRGVRGKALKTPAISLVNSHGSCVASTPSD